MNRNSSQPLDEYDINRGPFQHVVIDLRNVLKEIADAAVQVFANSPSANNFDWFSLIESVNHVLRQINCFLNPVCSFPVSNYRSYESDDSYESETDDLEHILNTSYFIVQQGLDQLKNVSNEFDSSLRETENVRKRNSRSSKLYEDERVAQLKEKKAQYEKWFAKLMESLIELEMILLRYQERKDRSPLMRDTKAQLDVISLHPSRMPHSSYMADVDMFGQANLRFSSPTRNPRRFQFLDDYVPNSAFSQSVSKRKLNSRSPKRNSRSGSGSGSKKKRKT